MSSRINILRCFLFLALSALQGYALTLDELEKSYEQKLSDFRLEKEKSLASLNEGYLDALTRIEAKYQRAGRLDEVMLTRQEIKDLTDKKWPLNALPEKISLDTAAPRKIYLKKRIEIEQQAARGSTDTADKMRELLDKKAVELTKEGDLQQALLARQIKAEIEADPDLANARQLLSNVMPDGTTLAVLRLRRFGDNKEVLVKHDSRGQISLLSPIQNVQESDKSIGDTTATNLGEFVGAKGYKVDPYVSLNATFDGRNVSNPTSIQMDLKTGFEIADRKGSRLSFMKGAKTPYLHLVKTVPPKSTPGALRIEVSYYIPKSNRHVSKFVLVQGEAGGAPLGGVTFDRLDQWTRTVAESESVAESPNIVLAFQPSNPVAFPDAVNDFVVIESIMVEQIRFSAFLMQRFDNNGTELERHDKPENQPLFIANGEIVTTR